MKQGILTIFLVLTTLTLQAQQRFGNEWIRAGQQYLKLSVNQTGIYRISYQDLKAADATFFRTNPAHWQLFFRGKEVAIRVVGQQDGAFDESDYLEFYGEGNDGSQDSLLYRPQQRLHPYQTLFSDVTAYFLTSDPTAVGKRIPESTLSTQGLTAEKFHVEETVQAFTDEYTFNNLKGIEPPLQQSYFEPGEGWSGKLIRVDSIGTVAFKVTGRVATDWPIRVEGMVNGRDFLSHRILVQSDANPQTPLAVLDAPGFSSQTFQATINPTTLQNGQLSLRFRAGQEGGTTQFSVTYVKLSYPQALDMASQSTKVFHVPAGTRQTALLAIQNVPSGAVAYDITDKTNCRYLTLQGPDGQRQVVVDETNQGRNVLLTSKFLKPLAIEPARFRFVYPKNADFLIITHASLTQSATAYANYRASAAGGRFTSFMVNADSLYDQFNYGERSPLALRRFADYMLANTAVKYLFLLGKANSYPYYVKTASDDLVPTIGYPGSDVLLTAGLNGYAPNTPAIPTGRLNVLTNDQVMAYLTKVKQFETSVPNGLWRKNIIHISGGKSEFEAQGLRNAMRNLGDLFQNGLLGGHVTSYSKTNPYDAIESVNIAPVVNEGVSLITFFGHAGPSITDVDFGYASPPQNGYANPFYPLMVFNGCGVGEIFSRFNTLSTDWLLAPDKGAAVVLAHSYYSYEEPTTRYLNKLYGDLFGNPATLGMSLGKIQQQLNAALEKEGVDLHDVAVLTEMILQGDPALVVYPLPNPDYAVEQKGIYLESTVAGGTLRTSDSIRVVVPMANLGRFSADQPVNVSVKTTSKSSVSHTVRFNAFRYRDTLVYTIPRDENLQQIDVLIDPDNQLAELSRANNTATLTVDWAQAGAGSSYPLNSLPDRISPALNVFINGTIKEDSAVVNGKPRVEVLLLDENALIPTDLTAVDMYLSACDTCSAQKIAPQSFTIVSVSANQLKVTTNLDLKPGATYQLIVFGKDAAGNRTQPPYVLTITAVGTDQPIRFTVYPNPATTYAKFELDLPVQELPDEARLTIYNLLGVPISNQAFPVAAGRNSLLWQANTAGLYTYTLRLVWKDGRTEIRTGKVIWQ
ncbi:hypothetical protein GCM10027341_39460 [Spirosoma knui]